MQSGIPNHINRNVSNINQSMPDHVSNNDSEIEIVDIQSPRAEQGDLDQHESAMNEAWHFIKQARHILANTEDIQPNISRQRHRKENMNDTNNYDNINESCALNESFFNIAQKITQERNFFYATINDYLDELENSSEDEIPCKMKQNYLNNGNAEYKVYDSNTYMDERPVFIYSYKNMNFIPESNEEFINSPNKGSPVSSGSSASVENFNEEMKYERNFYKISTCFNPVVIPRLPLEYMLPTVTEVVEPSRQSPKVTEISNEEDDFLQRKTINSWVTIEEKSTKSETDDMDTSVENYADEFNKTTKQTYQVQSTALVSHQNGSIKTDVTYGTVKNLTAENSSFNEARPHKSPQSPSRSTVTLHTTKTKSVTKIKDIDNEADVIQQSMVFCGDDTFNSHSRKLSPTPRHFLSESSCIPSLRLSLSNEIDKINHSWFARCLKCIFCCKVTQ